MTKDRESRERPGERSRSATNYRRRMQRLRAEARIAQQPATRGGDAVPAHNATVDCGWGRVLFGQTFDDPKELVAALRDERAERRDIAFYVRDPHVVVAHAPQEVFLDPSNTYRLELPRYRPAQAQPRGFTIRRLSDPADPEAVNRIYAARNMVAVPPEFLWSNRDSRKITVFLAEDEITGQVVGTVTGIDHRQAFGDPDGGSSLWCLAVDPQAVQPGIGEALVRRLAEHFAARGAQFMDLSVMHDNAQAIALYERIGFVRVPVFAVKRKNPINEALFTGPVPVEALNPYAKIIVDEADQVLGHGSKKFCHLMENIAAGNALHRAFSVFLFSTDGKLLLQKRSSDKILFPNRWTNTCCSHPLYTPEELDNPPSPDARGVRIATVRKLEHELGIPAGAVPAESMHYMTRIVYKAAVGEDDTWGEHEVDYILLATADVECSLNPNEVSEIRYLAKEELGELLAQEERNEIMLSPWFKAVAQKWLPMWWDALLEGKIDSVKDTTTIHILS